MKKTIHNRLLVSFVACLFAVGGCPSSGSDGDASSGTGQAAAPTFSPDGGHFVETASVAISCATEGAKIYYTIDGSAPTLSSAVYSGPVTVSDNATVKAVASAEGMGDSEVSSSASFYITRWKYLGAAGISAGEARHTDLALGSDARPYCIFSDGGVSDKAVVKKWTGSAWQSVGDAVSVGVANYTSIAVFSSTVYATFQDTTTIKSKASAPASLKTCAAQWDGSSWQSMGTAPVSDTMEYNAICVTGAGVPVVVYVDTALSSKTVVEKWTGSSWELIDSSGISDIGASFSDIATDGTEIYAALKESSTSKVAARKWNSSSLLWDYLGAWDGFSDGAASYLSVGANAAGTPYIAFKDEAHDGKASVYAWDGSSWSALGSAGFSSGTADYTAIAFDAGGLPWIVFRDGANDGKATVLKWDGTSWSAHGRAGFTPGGVSYTNIVMDGSGNPYVIFRDEANGNRASVMYYGE